MKKLFKRLSARRHMYDDELFPAYIIYELQSLIRKLERYSSNFPEHKEDCVKLVKSLVDTIDAAEDFAEKAGCSVRIDGV